MLVSDYLVIKIFIFTSVVYQTTYGNQNHNEISKMKTDAFNWVLLKPGFQKVWKKITNAKFPYHQDKNNPDDQMPQQNYIQLYIYKFRLIRYHI